MVGLLAVLFALEGATKILGTPNQVESFERWGYPSWFRSVVGILEVSASAGLLHPRLRFWAASGILGLMVGAAWTHIRAHEFAFLGLPAAAFVLAAVVAWMNRPPPTRGHAFAS